MHPLSTDQLQAVQDKISHCTKDIPTLCTECIDGLTQLAVLNQWNRVETILLEKEMDGTMILNGEQIIKLDLTLADILPISGE